FKDLPSIGSSFRNMDPIYQTCKGWNKSTSECRSFKYLPAEAQKYLDFLSEQLDVPIALVSVGPKRDQTIVIEDPIHGPKRVLTRTVGINPHAHAGT
ncbi:MAG: adenylosuccinate synthetase, partial [Terriglobales bacterium]